MSLTRLDLEFTKEGTVYDNAQAQAIVNGLPALTDLIVLSHGWNNDVDEAQSLYKTLLDSVDQVLGANVVTGLDNRRFGVVQVLWPSKRFAEADLIPGGGAASANNENDQALMRLLEELKRVPVRLGSNDVDPARVEPLERAKELVPQLDSPQAQREFVECMRSILTQSHVDADDGSDGFFHRDPETMFLEAGQPVKPPAAVPRGGATRVERGAASLIGDLVEGVRAAARRIANYATYYDMKHRAGTVGESGLGPFLKRVRQAKSDLRIHLAGHSFGGRLVTAAANTLDPETPAVTLTLLQAAFSHNGLAAKFDGRNDGAFREVCSKRRISGPILITHTKNDLAVGIAYPLASRWAGDQATDVGDANDPYGGMGRNGAQRTAEAAGRDTELGEVGSPYSFTQGAVFNLLADQFIKSHGNVTGAQVAYALLRAIQTLN